MIERLRLPASGGPARALLVLLAALVMLVRPGIARGQSRSQAPVPELTAPVNDFAHVIDASSAQRMDQIIRALQAASGDVVVVATVPTMRRMRTFRSTRSACSKTVGAALATGGRTTGC